MRFSILPAAFAVVCVAASTSPSFAAEEHGHHHHAAPHDGTLVALGEEAAHLELVLDSTSGQLTGYVLDGEGEKAIRIPQSEIQLQIASRDVPTTLTVALKPVENALTGEKAGDTSQFQATDAALKGKKKFSVTIGPLTIKGTQFNSTTSKFPEGNH